MNTEKLSNEAENPALNKGAVSSSTYYGTLSINDRLLTVVKVIDGNILEKRMIKISFWKSFLEKKDYKNVFHSMSHSANSYYRKEQLNPRCDEKLFNDLYSNALKVF